MKSPVTPVMDKLCTTYQMGYDDDIYVCQTFAGILE